MEPKDVIEVFRRNLTEHYFDTKGRVARREFWYFVLASVIISVGAAIIGGILGIGLLQPLVGLALLLPTLGLGIRRLQDTGKNGTLVWVWAGLYAAMMVLTLITLLIVATAVVSPYAYGYGYNAYGSAVGGMLLVGGLTTLVGLGTLVLSALLIYFWVQPGTPGDNAYGPEPKPLGG